MPRSSDLSFLLSRSALKRIAAATVAGAVVGILYALLAPKWYQSVLTVVPTKQQRGGSIASMLGGELGGLAASLDGPLGGGADAPRIAAVLQSIAVSNAVIEKFDLRTRYKETYREGARRALWSHCDVKVLAKPGLVQLRCEDKDPRFVQSMLEFMASHGNEAFRRVSVSSASEEVRFLVHRVEELRKSADESAARMRAFQEKHGIIDLDSQAKAVVSSLASLQAQRIAKQMELDFARTFSGSNEATLQQLRSQLGVMTEQLRDLEQPKAPVPEETRGGKPRREEAGKMFPAALAVPALRAEFEELFRDRKVAEVTLVIALDRLENAKANEARDVSTFQVLDPPELPTRHSRPKRLEVVMLFTFLGLAGAIGYLWARARNFPASLLSAPPVGRRPAPAQSDEDPRRRHG